MEENNPATSHNGLDLNKSADYQRALFRQNCILRVGHHVVAAKNNDAPNSIAKELGEIINANSITVYELAPNDHTYKLRFQSAEPTELAGQSILPKKVKRGELLWQQFTALSSQQLTPIECQTAAPPNTYGITRRHHLGPLTVLLLRFTEGIAPSFSIESLHWLYLALEKSLTKVRQAKIIRVEHASLQYLIQRTDEAFARWQQETGWRYFNEHPLYRLGYQASELAPDDVFGCSTLVNAEEWRQIHDQFLRCRDLGEDQRCYYDVVAPDGSWRSMLTTLVRIDSNSESYINAVTVDITDAKLLAKKVNAQQALEQWLIGQNKLLHQQGSSAAVAQVLRELSTQFSYQACAIYRWQKQSPDLNSYHIVDTPQSSLCPEILRQAVSHLKQADLQVSRSIQIDSQQTTEPLLAPMKKSFGPLSVLLTPICSDQPEGFLLCLGAEGYRWTDLEQRASTTLSDTLAMVLAKESILQKLETTRTQFQMALNAANYGLWELKIPEQEIKVSANYYRMLGYDHGETDFRPLNVKNIHIDDKDTVMEQGRRLREGLITEVDYETRHHGHNGEIKWIQTRGRVIKWDDTGRPLRAMGTTSDITELKKVQTDLRIAYQQAEAARLAKGEFLARMSHEIRTPMNAIIGLTYMSLQADISSKLAGYLEDIDRAAKTLLQIIDDILDFSKIEAGKLTIEEHNFNLHRHIERICQRYGELAPEKGLRFALTIAPDVPHLLRADSTRIRQVLVNLLNNAFKFTNRGEITLSINCEKLHSNQRQLIFEVKDTGIGLDPNQLANLFDPFTQADGSRTRLYGGTGLGLSICKLLVEMMGGEIYITSEKHHGSTFTFSVKCQSIARRPKQSPVIDRDEATQVDRSQFAGKKVLLVEDNKVNQKVAVGMLRQLGMQTIVANNGTEAFFIMKATDKREFDVVLMDIEMPYMGGFEATKAIRRIARHRHIPIVAMTAHVVGNDKTRYQQAGMSDCISKPIAPATLANVLEKNIRGSVNN